MTQENIEKKAAQLLEESTSLGNSYVAKRHCLWLCDNMIQEFKFFTDKIDDFRAKRITSYLNLINTVVDQKFEDIKKVTSEKSNTLMEYFNMLPNSSSLINEFKKILFHFKSIQSNTTTIFNVKRKYFNIFFQYLYMIQIHFL